MHIHGNPMSAGAAVHSAGAAEKAASAARASETRRKLLKSAFEADGIEGELDFGHFMIGGREEGSGGQRDQSQRPFNRYPSEEEEPEAKPVSLWA